MEMGDILRDFIAGQNIIGNYIATTVNTWEMIDCFLPIDIFEMCLKISKKEAKLLVIDGFPRRMDEAAIFDQKMKEFYREYLVVHLELSKEKAMERMLKRASIEWRKDDTPEVIAKRIELFEQNTIPVIEYFESLGKLVTIGADKPIDEVQAELKKKLGF